MEQRGTVRIGISGWRYAGWRGVFYPTKLAQRRELEFASSRFPSVELNGSFYSMQRPESFAQWCEQTPNDFQFAVKGSRFITHMKKLRDIDTALANFFAQGVLRLGPKFGPILWQFAPQFQFKPDLLAEFFQKLPRTHKQAAKLAKMHDHRLDGREWVKVCADLPMRHAIEIRHDSFITPEFITLLRAHNIGLVVADTVDWPLLMDITADFVYCRLHGSKQLYVSGYGPKALDTWARRVAAWACGQESPDGKRASTEDAPKLPARDVYVYFDNDSKVRAPFDAINLIKRVDKLLPPGDAM